MPFRVVTIDNTGGGAKTGWPVLVHLTSSNFDFGDLAASAQLEFRAAADPTVLPHWVETFDAGAETADLWVKVPSIGAGSSTTVRLFYGADVSGSASASATFTAGVDLRDPADWRAALFGGTVGAATKLGNNSGDGGTIATHTGAVWRQHSIREQSNVVWTGAEWVTLISGRDNTTTTKVGLYTADTLDGTWTGYASNPVLPQAEDPHIVITASNEPYVDDDGWFYVTYERKPASGDSSTLDVGVARTKNFRDDWEVWDGDSWATDLTTGAAVLTKGASGWDQTFAQSPTTVHDGTQFVCVYEGANGTNFRTGVARSADLVTWTKEPTNPVLAEDVPDDLWFDGDAWWMTLHADSGDQFLATTTDSPAEWDSSSWTVTPAATIEDSTGSSIGLVHGPGGHRWATYQPTIGTSPIGLWNWVGPDWGCHRSNNGRAHQQTVDVVGDALVLKPLDSGSVNGDVAVHTTAAPVTSNFEIVARRKVVAQTDDQNAGIAVGSGVVVVDSDLWLSYSDGYVFAVVNPDEIIEIREYTAGSFVTTQATDDITTAEAQAYGRHAMSYLSSGDLDYKVNGTSRVSRTDTTHVAAAKQIMLWQSNNTTRRGGVSHYEWVVVRSYDGVDPAVTIGAEVPDRPVYYSRARLA
jgi:hypothetical protein